MLFSPFVGGWGRSLYNNYNRLVSSLGMGLFFLVIISIDLIHRIVRCFESTLDGRRILHALPRRNGQGGDHVSVVVVLGRDGGGGSGVVGRGQ